MAVYGVLRRVSVPKIIYFAIIFSIAFQPLLATSAAFAHGEPLNQAIPSVPTGGSPDNETKLDTSFSFVWAPSVDESTIGYQVRISQDKTQVGDAPDMSLAWYSPNLTEANLPASTIPHFGSGVWYWQVRAMDAADNKSGWSDIWTVTVDTAKPTIEILRPLEGGLFSGVRVPFQAAITDTSELAFIAVALDGQDITVHIHRTQTEAGMHLQKEWQPRELADGNHTFRIVAKDIHGHTNEAIRSFAIDTKPPEIITTITEGQTLRGMASLDLMANELGVYTIRITANGHEVLAQDNTDLQTESVIRQTRVWNTREVADGKYTITFTGKDEAGNESVVTRQVIVANAASVGIVTVKDPLLEELSTSLSQPLAIPQLTATTPRVASSIPLPDSSDIIQPYDELLAAVPQFNPVVATENGWRLFGILWYWWVLSGLLMATGATYAWRSIRAPFQQIPW